MGAHASISSSSSSAVRQRRTNAAAAPGSAALKTTTSLSAPLQNDAKLSSMPTAMRADRGPRIADEPADDRGDERLQADDEAGVVVHRRHRADQHADEAGQQRREQYASVRRARRPDADEARADAIDRGRAQRLAGERALEEQKEAAALNTTRGATISSVWPR